MFIIVIYYRYLVQSCNLLLNLTLLQNISLFRFRCGVPVVLMGETGCGKTTLIRFMCALSAGPSQDQTRTPKNMMLVKVRSGK